MEEDKVMKSASRDFFNSMLSNAGLRTAVSHRMEYDIRELEIKASLLEKPEDEGQKELKELLQQSIDINRALEARLIETEQYRDREYITTLLSLIVAVVGLTLGLFGPRFD